MNCPQCGGHNSKVLESRIADAGDAMRRRRECLDCTDRYTTYERAEQATLWVAKHGDRQEPFDSDKLLRGLAIACSKRDIPAERLEVLVQNVELALREGGRKEVSSDEVGELALAGLVRIDEAAAIRFASVIEGAESIDGFRQVLDRMADVAARLEGHQELRESSEGNCDAREEVGALARTREALAVG